MAAVEQKDPVVRGDVDKIQMEALVCVSRVDEDVVQDSQAGCEIYLSDGVVVGIDDEELGGGVNVDIYGTVWSDDRNRCVVGVNDVVAHELAFEGRWRGKDGRWSLKAVGA